jgi:hypothetical protein
MDFHRGGQGHHGQRPDAMISAVSPTLILVPRQRAGARGDPLRVPLLRIQNAWSWVSSTRSIGDLRDIPAELKPAVEDVVRITHPGATEALLAIAEMFLAARPSRGSRSERARGRSWPVAMRLEHALSWGSPDFIDEEPKRPCRLESPHRGDRGPLMRVELVGDLVPARCSCPRW